MDEQFDTHALTVQQIIRELQRMGRYSPTMDCMVREFAVSMTDYDLARWRRRSWTRPPWQSGRRKSIGVDLHHRNAEIWRKADDGIGEEW